jgi:hypothetical protein
MNNYNVYCNTKVSFLSCVFTTHSVFLQSLTFVALEDIRKRPLEFHDYGLRSVTARSHFC